MTPATSFRPTNDRTSGFTTAQSRAAKLALILGFASMALAIIVAHLNPADGYEVDIYQATPLAYWVLLGAGLLVAVLGSIMLFRTRLAPLALLLGGIGAVSIVSLPVIRSYRFLGYEDPLTHLGTVRALRVGARSFETTIYPGSHTLALFLSDLGGITDERAMLTTMILFALVFFVSVPLAAWALTRDRRALYVGAFSAFLLLPVNDISLLFQFHPFSLTTLYFPFIAYLLFKHITRGAEDETLPSRISAASLVMLPASAALVFFHPQVTVDVIIMFAAIVGVQLLYRLGRPNHPINGYRAIYGQFIFLSVIFVVWAFNHETTIRTLELFINSLVSFANGTGTAGEQVSQRANAGDSIGVSLAELFVKLFLVSAAYCALAGGLVVAKLAGWLNSTKDPNSDTVTFFMYAGLGLAPFVIAHSFGKIDAYLFRHIGFAMAIVTILGTVALTYLMRRVSGTSRIRVLRGTLAIAAILAISLSVPVVYASPYIYLPGQHVSDYQMDGIITSYENQPVDRAVWYGGMRKSTNRYEAALYAAPGVEWEGSPDQRSSGPVTDENLTHLVSYYSTYPEPIVQRDHYMPVTEVDFDRELIAYRGIRYSEENMSSISTQRDVHRIQSNGEFDIYYVDTPGNPTTGAALAAERDSIRPPPLDGVAS